jgi:uncharacterized protein YjiS (DUF1127 family)
MTYLRSVPSGFDNVLKLPLRSGPRAVARGFAARTLRSWSGAVEARRARRRVMELDDHLLRDIGLARCVVCFGDFEALEQHRRMGGFR